MSNGLDAVGIDHGTMNSAIAVMGQKGPEVLKPNGLDTVMPSAVYINSRGVERVGAEAYRAILTNPTDEGDGVTGYKTAIGQNDLYEFRASRKVKSARQLGAMVIGALVKVYEEELQKKLSACVITVPAKFDKSATDGTGEAARLAGIQHFDLLQEPIAASLAYGFSTQSDRGQWLVFDLGAGTFDVSLVVVRKGELSVPEHGHGGDNFLGGRYFDRDIMDYALKELRKQYALASFAQENPKYRSAWGRLMLAVEQAKIELSDKPDAVIGIHGDLCQDEKGVAVKVDIPITRQDFERMIAGYIERAIHLCENVFNNNRITSKDIDRLILVGGPTKIPYVQHVLRDRLQIPFDTSVDPMSAVAMGAAIYATTMEIPDAIRGSSAAAESKSGDLTVKLQFEKRSGVPKHPVVGIIEGHESHQGLTVELVRQNVPWSSGRIAVDDTGMFDIEVPLVDLGKPNESTFRTTVYDGVGKPLATIDDPKIWYPFPRGNVRLASSLRVALRGNATKILIKQGEELPKHGRTEVKTAKALRKGDTGEVLSIPILESVQSIFGEEDDHADCSFVVGTMEIKSCDHRIKRDIPQGTAIDLTIHQDTSQQVTLKAHIPLLDEEFSAVFKDEKYGITVEDVVNRFGETKKSLEAIRGLDREKPNPEVAKRLKIIDEQNAVAGISKELDRAKGGERDALYRGYKRTLELTGGVNVLLDLQRVTRLEWQIERLDKVCKGTERNDLDSIRAELNAALESKKTDGLDKLDVELDDLDRKIRRRPLDELLLDLATLQGRRVNAAQNAGFTKASELYDEIEKKGGRDAAGAHEMSQAEAMHRELESLYPDLYQWRTDFLAGLGEGNIEDIMRKGPKTDVE
jgi:molecular chaperone DnaK